MAIGGVSGAALAYVMPWWYTTARDRWRCLLVKEPLIGTTFRAETNTSAETTPAYNAYISLV